MGQQRELEVTVLSAQDLKNVKFGGGSMNPYPVAWIYPNMKVPGAENKNGGVNPVWNTTIRLICEENILEQGNATITVEIYNHGMFSNKLIGTASIPLSDMTTKTSGSSGSKSASYQIRKKSGNFQGVVNVTVKLGKVLTEEEVAARMPPARGIPAMNGQYAQQGYNQQQYPGYYPGAQYGQPSQGYYQQQAPQGRRGGFGGLGGAGLGLGGGLLGGMLLGSALDGGFGGGDGGGGGGCGGGGGGCGGS